MHALVDLGSTHSYICIEQVSDKLPSVEPLAYDMLKVNLENIPMIKEFPDVFPEELPGLPPEREIYLVIEVLPRTVPISRAPHLMAPTKLKE